MASAGLAAAVLAVALLAAAASAAVTYDRKAVVVNGQRRILLSGSIHYPRSVPEVRRTPLLFPFPGPSGTPAPAVPSPPEMRARWGSAAAVRGACLTPLACVLACFFWRADVAGSDTEGQGRRPRRGADVRLLERPRALPWTGS